jgi:hypothetical protein
MAHCVTGVIARVGLGEAFARKNSLRAPVQLSGELVIVPLRDVDLDSFLTLPLTGGNEGFVYLSDQLMESLVDSSVQGMVMYFETEYFGGIGTQGAVVLEHGKVLLRPRVAESGPINEALALFGVEVRPPARDEFDTVGLGRYRSTDAWLSLFEDDA